MLVHVKLMLCFYRFIKNRLLRHFRQQKVAEMASKNAMFIGQTYTK